MKIKEPRKKYAINEWGFLDKVRLTGIKNGKIVYSITVTPQQFEKMFAEITKKQANPEKITLWRHPTFQNVFEIYSYKDILREKWFLSHEGDWITIEKDEWRRLFRVLLKIGNYLGILGRKKLKKQNKKTNFI